MNSLAQKLAGERGEVKFQKLDLRKIKEVNDGTVTVNGSTLVATPWAERQVLKALHIPASFYHELDKKLQLPIIEHQRALYGLDEEYKMRLRDGRLTGIMHPSHAEARLETLLAALPQWTPLSHTSVNIDDPFMNVKVAAGDLRAKGDQVHGFELVFSEVGACDMKIEALMVELECENGMVRTRPAGDSYFRLPMTVFDTDEFEVVAQLVAPRLQAESERVNEAIVVAQEALVDPEPMVMDWLDRKGIPTGVPKKTLARLEADEIGSEISRFELARLVSNVGSTTAKHYRARRPYEQLAGALVGLSVDVPVSE